MEIQNQIKAKPRGECQWFLLCKNDATIFVPHPILGNVPTCKRCYEQLNA